MSTSRIPLLLALVVLLTVATALGCDDRSVGAAADDAAADDAAADATSNGAGGDAAPPTLPDAGPAPTECLEAFSNCACDPVPDCQGQDGFTILVLFPETAGDFPSDIFPSDELLDVAVARYDCTLCTCATFQLKIEGQWVEVTLEEFCAHVSAMEEHCGDCLAEWWGGCC